MTGDVCDDLDRQVYCLQGIPIDAVTMQEAISRVTAAATSHKPFLLSTPNLNFVVSSQADPQFCESLRTSDLCPPDGAPLIWMSRLLRIPITKRVAGSDIFDSLVAEGGRQKPVGVYLFGGAEGLAEAAAKAINSRKSGVICVGWMNPGFGSIDEMSDPKIIDAINDTGAQFLLVALGANKGQAWLQRNRGQLTVPVCSHLGATIALQAGTVRRAPPLIRRFGLEWLWRIKEEPYLWRRYATDGSKFLTLIITKVFPLSFIGLVASLCPERYQRPLHVATEEPGPGCTKISLAGVASAAGADPLKLCLREVTASTRRLEIDMAGLIYIDARVLGLMLMARKRLLQGGGSFRISASSRPIRILLGLHGLSDLLDDTLKPVDTHLGAYGPAGSSGSA